MNIGGHYLPYRQVIITQYILLITFCNETSSIFCFLLFGLIKFDCASVPSCLATFSKRDEDLERSYHCPFNCATAPRCLATSSQRDEDLERTYHCSLPTLRVTTVSTLSLCISEIENAECVP